MRAQSSKRGSVHPVDITGNERRLGARTAAMQKVAEQFARGARRSLPFLVRRRARLVPNQIGPATIATAEPSSGPVCQITLESGQRGFAALRVDAGAMAFIVDGSLGGATPEEGDESEPLPITQLSLAQRALVTRVARALGGDLCEALREVTGSKCAVVRAECVRAGEEPLLPRDAVTAECVFEGVSGRATIWLFASGEFLEAAAREETGGGALASGDPRMVQAMAEVPLEVVAELGRLKLGLRRILALRPGEVLRLPTATDDPIQVRIGGIPKLIGSPVLSRGQVSVQITGRHGE